GYFALRLRQDRAGRGAANGGGKDIRTALTQIAAKEIDPPIDHITVIQSDTALPRRPGPGVCPSLHSAGGNAMTSGGSDRSALVPDPDPAPATARSGVPGETVACSEFAGHRLFSRRLDRDAPRKEAPPASATALRRWPEPRNGSLLSDLGRRA